VTTVTEIDNSIINHKMRSSEHESPLCNITSDWLINISLYTRGSAQTMPTSGVYGLGAKMSSSGIATYTGYDPNWAAVVLSAQVADSPGWNTDHYVLQASIVYNLTYGLRYGYGVWNCDTHNFDVSNNSPNHKPLHDCWLQIFFKQSDRYWYLQVIDAQTSTIVWQYKWQDPYGGTQLRTSPNPTGAYLQDWACVESTDTNQSHFPSGFVTNFYYAQWMDINELWHSLTQAYTFVEPGTPNWLYIQPHSGSTPERCGVLGSGIQQDAQLISM